MHLRHNRAHYGFTVLFYFGPRAAPSFPRWFLIVLLEFIKWSIVLYSGLAVETHVQVCEKKKKKKELWIVPKLREYPVGALVAGNLEKQLGSLE